MCVRSITQLPLDITVMRELSVLLTALCSSSRAVIISSIWARFPRPAESGWVLALPILTPAELIPAGHLCTVAVVPSTAGLLFSIQFFRYWLGFSVADTSGDAGGWLRWEWGLKNPAITKNEKLIDHLQLRFVVLTEAKSLWVTQISGFGMGKMFSVGMFEVVFESLTSLRVHSPPATTHAHTFWWDSTELLVAIEPLWHIQLWHKSFIFICVHFDIWQFMFIAHIQTSGMKEMIEISFH